MSEKVRKMFADISGRYDLMNNVLSLGIHHSWRKQTVAVSGDVNGKSVLDCAAGTGDLAIEFAKHGAYVTATDFCEEMLVFVPQKARKSDLNIEIAVADAMNLPYHDNNFDIASIAFGIRNVDDPAKALADMARVVKPGGLVVVLEFGQPDGIFGAFYQFYSKNIMPFFGRMIAGNKQAYEYLPQTAAKFPSGNKFLAIMDSTGAYEYTRSKKLSLGIAYIYAGKVKIS